MFIKYRILKRNESDNTLEIRYFTDVVTEDMLASFFDSEGNIIRTQDGYPERCRTDVCVNIEIPNPTEEDIHTLAKNNALSQWLKLKEDIVLKKVVIESKYVNKMIGKVYSFDCELPKLLADDGMDHNFDINTVLTQNNISKLVTALKNTNEF